MLQRLMKLLLCLPLVLFIQGGTLVNPDRVCPDLALSYVGTETSTTDAATYTFTDVSVGAAAATGLHRYIVAGGMGDEGSNGNTTVTIDGAGTQILIRQANPLMLQMVWLQKDSGTTATLVGTCASCLHYAIAKWRIESCSAPHIDSATDSSGTLLYSNIEIHPGGGLMAMGMDATGGTACSGSWNGVDTPTENLDQDIESSSRISAYTMNTSVYTTADDFTHTCAATGTFIGGAASVAK